MVEWILIAAGGGILAAATAKARRRAQADVSYLVPALPPMKELRLPAGTLERAAVGVKTAAGASVERVIVARAALDAQIQAQAAAEAAAKVAAAREAVAAGKLDARTRIAEQTAWWNSPETQALVQTQMEAMKTGNMDLLRDGLSGLRRR